MTLEPAERRAAATVLARAFDDSPLYRAVFAGESFARQAVLLDRVKAGFVRAFAHHGASRVVREEGTIAGVALITAPGGYPLSWADEVRQATGCATTTPSAIFRLLKLTAFMRDRHPQVPHFYLFSLGVQPAWQGKGIGKALLHELHARADAARVPSYLETEKATNVRLYESVGYRVVSEELVPALGVRLWMMQRNPSSGSLTSERPRR